MSILLLVLWLIMRQLFYANEYVGDKFRTTAFYFNLVAFLVWIIDPVRDVELSSSKYSVILSLLTHYEANRGCLWRYFSVPWRPGVRIISLESMIKLKVQVL